MIFFILRDCVTASGMKPFFFYVVMYPTHVCTVVKKERLCWFSFSICIHVAFIVVGFTSPLLQFLSVFRYSYLYLQRGNPYKPVQSAWADTSGLCNGNVPLDSVLSNLV